MQFPLSEGKKFQPLQTVNNETKFLVQYQKAAVLYNNTSTFVSPFYTFSLAGNIIVYTPIQGTNRKKYFNLIIYKGKMPTLAEKNTSPSILLS